ncbi:hypothetical protein MKEN_00530400 [Mycena kentingensis (nom. inval.)]|nr:hypothetical protein MKEN_00530400 [Mycena kentingensis (nom. inval.)]
MASAGEKRTSNAWYLSVEDVAVPDAAFASLSWPQAIKQGLLRFLAPTTSLSFTEKHKYFTHTFMDQVHEYSNLRKRIKQVFLVSRAHRISQLKQLCDTLDLADPPEQWDDEVDNVQDLLQLAGKTVPTHLGIPTALINNTRTYQVLQAVPSDPQRNSTLSKQDLELIEEYCSSIRRTRHLRSHLQEVEEDLANYAHLVNTQATAELTYFRGFRDWCQVMLQLTSTLSNSLIAVSTLGAGLVYSTVFGATRGDVALMCYCFPFFSCGFLLPVTIQVMLSSGACLQREARFASQRFWTIVVGFFMGISTLAVMASLTILNLTVFFLNSSVSGTDDTIPDAPSTPAPGIIAFSITGSVFLLVIVGALLSAIAAKAFTTLRGIRAVLSAMYGTGGQGRDALKLWVPV